MSLLQGSSGSVSPCCLVSNFPIFFFNDLCVIWTLCLNVSVLLFPRSRIPQQELGVVSSPLPPPLASPARVCSCLMFLPLSPMLRKLELEPTRCSDGRRCRCPE